MTHKFIFKEKGIYLVRCKKTSGEFSTELWRKGLVNKNKCPCCKEKINRRKENDILPSLNYNE